MSKAGRVDWAAKTKFWKASRERAESTEERGVLARGTRDSGSARSEGGEAAKAANVPDWMTDPSKLPKKPPASRPPDD